ncbi:MAG TPA: DUF1223 domain-containing protein [Bryobacteraceae bacterium]|nr:DUF1223 domain-containing protein [Bryobacteraceae bacterium]
MRLFIILSFLALSASGAPAISDSSKPVQPVVVELFTSEGCSSCPPADALLLRLDRTQPVPGALVIALSEHVDYWDHLGWRDPFSSPVFSRRQERYGQLFHVDSYTPQIVVDGTSQAVGSDTREVESAIRRSAGADKLNVGISEVFRNSEGVPAVHVQVEPSGKSAGRNPAQVEIALAENVVVSHVRAGENNGRKLDHVAVVRSLTAVGSLNSAGAFNADIPLTSELGQWSGKRIIAFVQDRQTGRIRGAAFRLFVPAASH